MFECQRCGACCRDIGISAAEYTKLRRLSNPEERRLLEAQIQNEKGKLIILGQCPFILRDESGIFSCRIYDSRPDVCRWYPPPEMRSYPKCKDEYNGKIFASKFWVTGIKFLMKDGLIVDPTMTAHLDAQPVGGVAHKALKKDTPADGAGEAVNVSNASTGYKNFRDGLGIPPGNATLGWAFQLTGVAKILATTWTYYFRSYVTGGTAHGNLGAQIRKNADNTLRQEIIAVDASGDTANFPTAYGTVSGTYNLAEYTVVDQTDWLICYWYAHVTAAVSGKKSYLQYDLNTLPAADQVRITNVSFQAAAVERSVSEPAIPVSDTISITVIRAVPISEPAISVADTPATAIVKSMSVDEPVVPVSDAVSYILQRARDVSEPSISVADAVELILRRVRDISEPSISVSDAVERGLFLSRDVSEPSISVADSPAYNLIRDRSPSESLGLVSDAVSLILQRYREVSEPTISVLDAAERAITRVTEISEPTIGVADAINIILQRAREISEPGIPIEDAVSYILQRARDVSEPSISVSDLTGIVLQRAVMVGEPPISVGDSPATQVIHAGITVERQVSEPSISLSDAVNLVLRRVRDIYEPPISVGDSPTRLVLPSIPIIERAVSEPPIGVSDSVRLALLRAPITYLIERTVYEALGGVTDEVQVKMIPFLAVAVGHEEGQIGKGHEEGQVAEGHE